MTDYTDDVTEAMTTTDVVDAVGAFHGAVSEAVALADAAAVTTTGYGGAISESMQLSDAVTGTAAFTRSVTEGMSLTDFVTAGIVYAGSVSEAMAFIDIVSIVPEPGQYDYYFEFEGAAQAKIDSVVGPYIVDSGSQNVGLYDTRVNEELPGFWVMLSQVLPLNQDFLNSPHLRLVVNANLQVLGQASVWATTMDRELLLHLQVVAFYAGGGVYGYSRIVNGGA